LAGPVRERAVQPIFDASITQSGDWGENFSDPVEIRSDAALDVLRAVHKGGAMP